MEQLDIRPNSTIQDKHSHPTALANFGRTQVKKCRTSQENIGFIGHMHVSVTRHTHLTTTALCVYK